MREHTDAPSRPISDPYLALRTAHIERARAYAPLLRGGQFFSHETAAALWEGPLPLRPEPAGASQIHVSVFGTAPMPRARGVIAHRANASTTSIRTLDGLPVSSPASTWAALGSLPLYDLVALGDHLCRAWRRGAGRPDAGRQSLTTIQQLRAAISAGRRVGNPRLREAVDLIREDAWSPRETFVRLLLLDAGLPEPTLNIDVFDDHGRFIGCVDLAYPDRKVGIEYHGFMHAHSYAKDVERMAALRAAGWIVIEVTNELLATPGVLVGRVRSALRS